MKFKDYLYQRPNIDEIKAKYEASIEQFRNAKDAKTQIEVIKSVFKIYDEVDTMQQLVSIRYSLNTQDEFYTTETDFMDEVLPTIQNYGNEFQKEVVASPFKQKLMYTCGQ